MSQNIFTFSVISQYCDGVGHWNLPSWNTGFPSSQRCVVRGIALSSLLSCRLPANLNSHGSSVAPTWAHLCWPGSRSVHGSIHACDRAAAFCSAGPPEVLSRMSRPVTQAAERERELARARSQRLKQAAQSLPGEPVSRGFAGRGALEGYPSHYTSLFILSNQYIKKGSILWMHLISNTNFTTQWEIFFASMKMSYCKSSFEEPAEWNKTLHRSFLGKNEWTKVMWYWCPCTRLQ